MSFYSEFSKNYDKIFPLNQNKLELLDKNFKDLKANRKEIKLLDVGCGTGSYALALAEMGYKLKGVDIDTEMISLAESKLKNKSDELQIDFYRLGMLHLKEKFEYSSFDGIYIIGNVLVHLDRNEIKEFLKTAAQLLKNNGKIFIQIVNYYRILELNLDSLPTLYSEDDSVRFERNYEYDEQRNIIKFKTKLIDHFEDEILSQNQIVLYPLFRSELEENLKAAGFEIKNTYGAPNGEQYRELQSIPLIITAQKEENK